jgi:predicted DNA-binding transcriptional regulator AlpA
MTYEIPTAAQRKAKTINDMCRKYGLCRNTIYKEMSSGALPYLQIRGRRRVTPEGEAEWLKRKAAK